MKRLAIITARAGSKGLPDKNMLMVGGKPLLAYTIESAVDSGMFDQVVLSTDSQEYIDILSYYPITMQLRPEHLANDQATSYDVIEYVLQQEGCGGYDYFVLFQPTSPQRTAEHTRDICRAFEACIGEYDFMASVCQAHKPTVLTRGIDTDGSMKHFDIDYSRYRRQNYLPEYSPNGLFFIAKPEAYLDQKHFYGPRSKAFFMDKNVSIDIDDRDDFEQFFGIIQRANRQERLRKLTEQELRAKQHSFEHTADVTFVGDAHLAQWPSNQLGGLLIQNLCLTPATTADYSELVVEGGYLQAVSPITIVSCGINDIRSERIELEETIRHTRALLMQLKTLDTKIILLDCPPTLYRVDCPQRKVSELNIALATLAEELGLQRMSLEALTNTYGRLSPDLTDDGLNLNAQGYSKLSALLSQAL